DGRPWRSAKPGVGVGEKEVPARESKVPEACAPRARAQVWRAMSLSLGMWGAVVWVASATEPQGGAPAAEQTNHWSLKPITRPVVPPVANRKWKVRTPGDNFIYQKLASVKMTPSPEAPRRTLICRLYFDLIGLPPTPAEVASFERDSAPDAYEKLIERLLDSPRYGERWAQHWLDVVRFAESHGF